MHSTTDPLRRKTTKRRFLQGVAAAAGAGALYRTMGALGVPAAAAQEAAAPALPAGSGAGRRVAILGAGVAGMAAAWELGKAGYACTILEATARAGGRNLTARGGDILRETDSAQQVGFGPGDHIYANMGPARIPYHHRAILGYCKEFGVALEMFVNDNRAAYFHNRRRFDGAPVAGRRVQTDMRGYVAELLAKAVGGGALDAELAAEDKERVLAMLVEYGDLDPDYLYKGSSRAGYRGASVHAAFGEGEPNDPLDFGELLRSDFWEYKLHFDDFLDQNPTLFQPVGGMDAIVRAFGNRVGGLIRRGAAVEEIRRAGSGARIVFRDAVSGAREALEADFVVCTIPAPVLRNISADFSAAAHAAIRSAAFVPAVKIAFEARNRFWEEEHGIYGGISWTDRDITQIWYPACGYHAERGVVIGAYIWDDRPGQCARFADMAPEERLRTAIAEGESVHPGYGAAMLAGASRAWAKVPYQLGGWPESYDPPAALRAPDGPFHFAGDQTTALPGWQEGAVLSAHAAVAAIGERAAREG